MAKLETKIYDARISDLTETEHNPRQISKKDFAKLKKSLKEFPEMLDIREVVIDENNVILGGHQRVKAALANGDETIPVKQVFGLTDEQKRQFVIKDNIANGDWDWDELANHWDDLDLDGWGLETDWMPKSEKEYDNDDPDTGGLVRKFGAPPLSVLETRQGYWQDRKKFWLDLGIESEQGRDGGLLGGFADMAERAGTKSNGTSVFDPFLCELMYDWFNVDGGTVIDPFAGGSVRGIVAARTGHPYTGLELRGEQVDANKKQAEDILTPDDEPADWITGDSDKTLDTLKGEYDMIFSCPPYADLEVYSDDPADLSNMSYDQFKNAYRRIINKAVLHLKDDRFAVFVVGEVRDNKRGGEYRGFVQDTIDAFVDAGCVYYNEIILVNSVSTAAMRASRQFNASRKVCKVHQNVLVFYKGNPKNIKNNFPEFVDEESEVENDDDE